MRRTILMTGGGTGGTIIPLLAVAAALRRRHPDLQIRFLTTSRPYEREMVERAGFAVSPFPAGKWRRYLDLRNVADLFVIAYACVLAFILLLRSRPAVVVSVGSFLSVPVVWIAGLLRIPVLIHQQDVEPGLANRLMRRFATTITAATEVTVRRIAGTPKPIVTGNPVRPELGQTDAERARRQIGLQRGVPVVCVIGGSSGARALDELLAASLDRLGAVCQIVHVTGRNTTAIDSRNERYYHIPFVGEGIGDLFAAADVIVTRAGFSTLSEIAIVGRPCIVIPMPETHQVANADYFADRGAALKLDQTALTPSSFVETITQLLANHDRADRMAAAMKALARPDAAERLATEILQLADGRS